MLNVLYKNVDWHTIEFIGFDLDGTLYDEYEFISQVYTEINTKLIRNEKILSFMLNRWIEKGSSYQFIFDEAYQFFGNDELNKEEFIEKALGIFRNFTPTLSLPKRNEDLLTFCKNNFSIFLISDGNYNLQERKFNSLGLSKFFNSENVIFTGKYSNEYHKPNIRSLELLNINPSKSIFFGDRLQDMNFAYDSQIKFKKVYNMLEVLE